MPTISHANGWWMSNNISTSRITQIANAGRASVRPEQIEQIDHSRDMDLGEKLFDYVFCGRVKKQYMDYLYEMARNRALLDNELSSTVQNEIQRERLRINFRTSAEQVNDLMAGRDSLKFAVRPDMDQDSVNRENYLIYEDRFNCTTIGLALHPQFEPLQAAAQPGQGAIPQFNSLDQIRIRDLEAIMQCGQLGYGNQVFAVRVSARGQPLVLRLGDGRQSDALQSRLRRLLIINKVKTKVTAAMNNFGETEQLLAREAPVNEDRPGSPELDAWTVLVNNRRDMLTKAVGLARLRANCERRTIENELERFEQLTDPTSAEKNAFLLLQTKIASFSHSIRTFSCDIKSIQSRSKNIRFFPDMDALEALGECLSHINAHAIQFILSNRSRTDEDKFYAACQRSEKFDWCLDSHIHELNNPFGWQGWAYGKMHPPSFRAQKMKLLALAKDPAVSHRQIYEAWKIMRQEIKDSIALRIRQIKLGEALHTIIAESAVGVPLVHAHLSPEYDSHILVLERIRDDLLTPGNFFDADQLDELSARRDRHLLAVRVEHGRALELEYSSGGSVF